MWRTWLIPGAKMDTGTERRLRQDFFIPDGVDLSLRPVVTLGVEDGQPVLGTENRDSLSKFFDELDRLHQNSGGSVRALSFASHEELRTLHGNCLWHDLRYYPVQWEGNDISVNSAPYARRFIQIEKRQLRPPKDLEEKQISNGVGLGRAPLFLSPIELSFDEDRAKASMSAGQHVWFLPPVREEDHPERRQSYFSIQRLSCRALLRQVSGLDKPDPDEPVAVLVQRLIDDPALRDLFLEGGGLRVDGAKGESTRVAIEVCEGDFVYCENEITKARARIVLASLEHVPEWAKALAAELRRDVESVIPGGDVRASPDGRLTDWYVESGNMARPVTSTEGIWHRLVKLEARLDAHDQGLAHLLREEVLRLSNPGERYNHDEALKLFSNNFWRRPWEASSGHHDAWLAMTVDLLRGNADELDEPFAKVTPEEWAERFDHTVKRNRNGLRVSYARSPSGEELLYWRLLYPLGAVINSRTLYLDRSDRSRLDTRLVLA